MSRIDSLLDRLMGLPRPLLVALDVDGTVAPIVRDPDLAEIPAGTLLTLAGLAAAPFVEVALITGRDLSSLNRMERLEGIWRAVEHGGVVLGPGETPGDRILTRAQRKALDDFADWVDSNARDAFIEHKPQAIAVHVRAVAARDPDRAERILKEADELAWSLGLHVRRGKALREAEAVHHDKGRALEEILRRSGAGSVFFAGDDLTDLPAIELAAERGIGVFIRSDEERGRPASSAVLLDSVDEVNALLSGLLERVRP